MKKTIFLLILTSIFLNGCSYGTDVEKQAFVVAVGIDKGEVFPLKITFVFANPGGSSGGIFEVNARQKRQDRGAGQGRLHGQFGSR